MGENAEITRHAKADLVTVGESVSSDSDPVASSELAFSSAGVLFWDFFSVSELTMIITLYLFHVVIKGLCAPVWRHSTY